MSIQESVIDRKPALGPYAVYVQRGSRLIMRRTGDWYTCKNEERRLADIYGRKNVETLRITVQKPVH